MSFVPSFAQSRLVEGSVTSAGDGLPLPGVSVVVVGTTIGTATNMDGKYSLKLNEGQNDLQFTFIGFEPQVVKVDGKTQLNVALAELKEELDEVTVVGYGTQTKREIVGAITSIDVSELAESVPAESVESLLQGQIAGVNIQMNTGEPGAAPIIMVRGLGKISRTNSDVTSAPLFVVDNVPFISNGGDGSNVLGDIDPNDIADITVLKDASAAAIYGSRALNGVIMITTKKGKSGRPQVTISSKVGVNVPGDRLKTVGGAYERNRKIDLYNRYNPGLELPNILSDSLSSYYNNSTDWQDEKYQNSVYQSYNVAIRGAGDFGNYSISLGHYDNDGTVVNTGFKRDNLMVRNALYALNKKLSINTAVAFTRTDNSRRVSIAEPSFTSSLLAPIHSPVYAGFDQVDKSVNTNIRDRFMANLLLKYYITPALNVESKLSINFSRANESFYFPAQIVPSLNTDDNPSATEADESDGRNYMMENVLSYMKIFKEKHFLTLMAGQSMEKNELLTTYITGDKRQSFSQTVNWPQYLSEGESDYGAYGMLSFYSRATYKFKEKYIVNGTVRADGSSKFGEDNKWGIFPSIGLGYVFSNDFGLEGNEVLSFGKLRASYGVVGGQFDQNYLAQGIMQPSSTYIGGVGFTPSWQEGFRNRELTWEQAKTWNFGLNLTLFKERLDVTADVYSRTVVGNLMDIDLPNTSGYVVVFRNAADIVNNGLEITFESTNIETNNFRWETNLNFAHNSNYVKTIYGGDEDIVRDLSSIIRVGKPANGMFFFKGLGIIQGYDEIPVNPANGRPLTPVVDRIWRLESGYPKSSPAQKNQ
jgi:TonB-linked SusC/RagA family outer membrane protein